MKGLGSDVQCDDARFDVLVFSSGGITMAVTTDQIEGISDPDQFCTQGTELLDLHGVPFHKLADANAPQKVLVIRDTPATRGVVIDRVEGIISFGLDSLRPLPPLIDSSKRCEAVWGAAIRDEEVIFLVDFHTSAFIHDKKQG